MKQYLTIQTENLLSYIFQFKCCVLYSTTSGFSQKCHFVLNSGGEIRDEIRKKTLNGLQHIVCGIWVM